jgi:phospholipid transport system substrate-binding protein
MTALPRRLATAWVVALAVAVAAPASAGPPTETLRDSVDRLFALLDDPALREPGRAAERHRMIRTLAEQTLDFSESARRALGTHWEARTEAERTRFVRLFGDLIDHAYLARLSHDGERLAFDSETITGREAVVKGRALSRSGSVTPVIFALHEGADGRWRAVDVSFEGMSLVGNYRAQFNKILRASSFDDLVARLEAKTRSEAQASVATEPAKTSSP